MKLKRLPITNTSNNSLVSANGSDIEIVGYTTVDLYFKGLRVEQKLGIAKQLSPSFLLGVNFLSQTGAAIDYALKPPMFTLFDGLVELPLYTRCDETNCVTLAQKITVPAFTEVFLPVNSPSNFNNQDVLLEQPPCGSPVITARALVSCVNNKTVCRILNSHPYVVTLRKGTKLARIVGLDSVAAITQCTVTDVAGQSSTPIAAVSRTELDDFHKSYGFQLCSELDEAKRYQALELLYRYKSVFARDITEIKQCKAEPMKLELHTNCRMFKRQYRLSEPDKVEMNRQINQMEKAGVIERSSSAYYNSPTYLVLKKIRSEAYGD